MMKKLYFLSLCVALGLFAPGCGDSSADANPWGEIFGTAKTPEDPAEDDSSAKTPEDLGKAVLMSLKKNDRDLYEKYVADYSDAQAALSAALRELKGEKKKEAEEVMKSDELKVKIKDSTLENLRSWSSVREEGESDGVEWKDARFVDADCEIRERDGMKGARDILVTFKSEGQTYVFEIDKALYCGEKKWKSTDELHWRGER